MQKVFDYIRQHQMINAEEKILVGVSGGADSLCLLFVLKEYRREVPFEMTAVHVEHGIRGQESREDAAFVEKICRREQVEYRCVPCHVPEIAKKEKTGLEEAARKARYDIFESLRAELGADKIAVAHNKNDQAETMLFQMARGSGLKGACGISPVRGHIIRPLLTLTREEIENYLKSREMIWRTDSTNAELEYARNCLRHKILPELEKSVNAGSIHHLAALGEELREVQEYLFTQVKNISDEILSCREQKAEMDLKAFREQPDILQGYLLREALCRAGCSLKDISRRHIRSMKELASGQSGRQITLPGEWTARREFGKIVIEKGCKRDSADVCFYPEIPGRLEMGEEIYTFRLLPNEGQNIPQKIYTKWFDYDKIGSELILRTRQPGDFLVADIRGSRKKLKSYFIEEKIPQQEREKIPLLAKENEIIWVTGRRISEAYKVTSATTTILEVQRRKKKRWRKRLVY